jgi:hypothetical protein
VRGPRFKSQDNYFSISIAVSLRSFPESPDLDFFSNGASRDCVTKCDLQRNLQRQRLKQLLRSTVNTPNHGFRHCGVNKLPVAQNVMVTVCGRAEWHQSIMTSPLHLGGLCSPWSLGHGRCPAPMPLLASNLCLTLDVTDQHSLTLCVADLLCNFFYETITQCSKSRFEFCGDLFAATIVTIQSSVERRGDLEAAAIYCNGYSCVQFHFLSCFTVSQNDHGQFQYR